MADDTPEMMFGHTYAGALGAFGVCLLCGSLLADGDGTKQVHRRFHSPSHRLPTSPGSRWRAPMDADKIVSVRLEHVNPAPNSDYEVWCTRCGRQIGAYTAARLADPDVFDGDMRSHRCGWRRFTGRWSLTRVACVVAYAAVVVLAARISVTALVLIVAANVIGFFEGLLRRDRDGR